MDHKENYTKLFNTLSRIETKGNNTLIMADCLKFTDQCINECNQEEERRRIAERIALEKAEAAKKEAEAVTEETE